MTAATVLRAHESGRPTLGLLASKLEPAYQAPIWRSVVEVARQRDVNLITFVGGVLGGAPDLPFDDQGNIVYDLPRPENVDGLLIIAGSLGTYLDPQKTAAFCHRYAPLPTISIGMVVAGIPSIITDNVIGLREGIQHLIHHHGKRRIAFIRGPEGHPEADLRYATYCEVLEAEGIPLNPDFVARGDFLPASPAVLRYLEQLDTFPEAIVAANDSMAITVLRALPRYGLRVPDDVAVIGFDDRPESRHATPPLTTVRQHIPELGVLGAALCLDMIDHKPVPELSLLPTTLLLRRSCGCHIQDVANAAVSSVLRDGIASMPELTLTEQIPYNRLDSAFEESLRMEDDTTFLHALEHALTATPTVDISNWHNAISIMRRTWVPNLLAEPASLVKAEDIWGQARILIDALGLSIEDADRTQRAYLAEASRATGEALTTTFNIDALMDVVCHGLPRLDIPACYIALYDDDRTPFEAIEDETGVLAVSENTSYPCDLPGAARLVLACRKGIGRNRELEGTVYQPQDILPAAELQQQAFSKIVHALYFREHQLGLAVFETGTLESSVYDSLRTHLSSALKGSSMLQQLRAAYGAVEDRVMLRTAELQQEIAERQKVEKIRAAMYRISEAAHNAQNPGDVYPVIHEIVSELMPARNFYIALYDSESRMITFPYFVDEKDPPPDPKEAGGGLTELVIRSGEPLLIDPQGFEALVAAGKVTSIGAPSLDWLGVPLTVQGQVIGALVAQTYNPAIRFSKEDRDVLVFVSTQIAVALKRVEAEVERQHLFSALQRRNTQLLTAAEVSKSALIYLDPSELVSEAVQIIQDRFGFYYIGLFLTGKDGPDTDVAVLEAGTGEPGKRMVDKGHRLRIDDTSMIGWCINHATARIASDVDKESIRFANPWLPATRSEAALPLISQSQGCLGALSVQSDKPDAFTDSDIAMLQTMADHLAIAIENARLHNEIRRYAGELEARVAERTAELVATNKELTSFSYSVSHDLRAPLRSIDGFSQALVEDYYNILDATGRDYLRRIRRATQRMGQLIDDLLKLSRISRGELYRVEVDLSALAAEILDELQERAPERHVIADITPGICVMGDARLLRIVMENLLSNAWKFSSRKEHAEIAFSAIVNDGQPTFYVRDTGVGFDMAYIDKLFGAFQRLHSADEFEGSGIGLATVQRIIHRHGGRIWADGKVGAGATFYFTLPQGSNALVT